MDKKNNNVTISSYLISEVAAKKLDKIHKESGLTKSFLINKAIIAYDKDPEAYPFNFLQKIGDEKRTTVLVLPVSTKDLLVKYRQEKEGFFYARFINALILNFLWDTLSIEDPGFHEPEYQTKSTKRNRHSDFSPSQILQQADAAVGEMDQLLKMFLGSEKTSQEAE